MNRRSGTRRWPARALLLATAVGGFAACSDDSDDDAGAAATSSSAPAESSVTTNPAVVQDVTDSPRTEGYDGARDDVTDLTCEQEGGVWRVGGTLTNPTAAAVDYRIFTAFLDAENETRGLLQTDVTVVEPAEARAWTGELALDADDLTCGLRVERTGVGGTPPPPTTEAP